MERRSWMDPMDEAEDEFWAAHEAMPPDAKPAPSTWDVEVEREEVLAMVFGGDLSMETLMRAVRLNGLLDELMEAR